MDLDLKHITATSDFSHYFAPHKHEMIRSYTLSMNELRLKLNVCLALDLDVK